MTEEKPTAWFTIYDKYGDEDGTLYGNKEGLQKIKESIDEALIEGVSKLDESIDCDFIEVRLKKKKPEEELEKETMKDQAMKYGCMACGLLLVVVFGFGIKGIIQALF